MSPREIAELASDLWSTGAFIVVFAWALAFGVAIFSYRSIRRMEKYRG